VWGSSPSLNLDLGHVYIATGGMCGKQGKGCWGAGVLTATLASLAWAIAALCHCGGGMFHSSSHFL
jgi:hypothetical protein